MSDANDRAESQALASVGVHVVGKQTPGAAKPIQVGDRVVCIDDTASFHRLQKGCQYVVEAAYDGTPTVTVNRAYHSIERFELVAGDQS